MIKKQLSVFCAFLISVGCSTENPQPQLPIPAAALPAGTAKAPDSNPPAKVSDSAQATDAVDIDAEEAAAIRSVSDIVSRVGAELRIRLLNGRTAILKDDTTAGLKFGLPRYAVYLKAIHSHVIHQYQYEGEGIYLVVDDSTGDSTIVWGVPVVSPDGDRFAFTSMEGMEGGNPGVIEVWRMVGRKPEKEFSFDTENEHWEPSDAVWRDSVTLDFFKNTHSSPADPYVQTLGRLKRTGTTWVLLESLADIPADAPAARDELFGQVASVFKAKDLTDAIRIANGTTFGLGASAWTRDDAERDRFVEEIESGLLFINGMVASDPRLSFGGVKYSGFGRELGEFGIREFVNIKSVRVMEGESAKHSATE